MTSAKQCCGTCVYGHFERTPAGRAKRNLTGSCEHPIPALPVMPISVVKPRLYKSRVWPDEGGTCPTYTAKL